MHRIDITTENGGTNTGSVTAVGSIKGFVQLDKDKTTGEMLIANVDALATAVHKDAVFIKYEGGGRATLAYNPKSKPNNIGDALLLIISSSATDYEVVIDTISWPIPEFKDREHVIAVSNYVKEIFKQYFPTKYEEVYKIFDSCFYDGKMMNKIHNYDNREFIIRESGMYISYIGEKIDSVR